MRSITRRVEPAFSLALALVLVASGCASYSEDDRLVVQSKNLAPAAIPLVEITRVEVKQFDGKSAANKFLVGTLVGPLVLTVAIFALL